MNACYRGGTPLYEKVEKLLQQRKEESLFRNLPSLGEGCNNEHFINIDGKELLNASSNDYLSMTHSSLLASTIATAAQKRELGSGASRLVTGNHALYGETEKAVENYFEIPSKKALLFGSGYACNIGLVSTLASVGSTELFYDELSHASLIDGGLLAMKRPKIRRYRHLSSSHLEQLLQKSSAENKIVITDGVFSMDGDCAPLEELILLKKKISFFLVVDDAHGIGALGESGKGLLEEAKLKQPEEIDALVGTFGKAFGLYGAFVLTANPIRNLLINQARSLIYSTALPPFLLAGIKASLAEVGKMQKERQHLKKMRKQLRTQLSKKGYTVPSEETPIVPVLIGGNEETNQMAKQCIEQGLYCTPIRPPTVPNGTSRLRLTLKSTFSEKEINHIASAFPLLKKGLE